MNYTEKLEKMYKSVYPCSRFSECSKNGENCIPGCGNKFYKAKLGKNYGKNNSTKIMFVGKEAPDDSGNLSQLSIEEPSDITKCPHNNYHYFKTIYTAAILANKTPKTPDRDDLSEFGDLRHNFCLTNYYKCAFKKTTKNQSVSVNSAMSKYCGDILLQEIELLQPEIIVIQGKFTNKMFWNGLETLSQNRYGKDLWKSNSCNISVTQYKYKNEKTFCVVWSYHPCAFGNKWEKCLSEFEQALYIAKNNI